MYTARFWRDGTNEPAWVGPDGPDMGKVMSGPIIINVYEPLPPLPTVPTRKEERQLFRDAESTFRFLLSLFRLYLSGLSGLSGLGRNSWRMYEIEGPTGATGVGIESEERERP